MAIAVAYADDFQLHSIHLPHIFRIASIQSVVNVTEIRRLVLYRILIANVLLRLEINNLVYFESVYDPGMPGTV